MAAPSFPVAAPSFGVQDLEVSLQQHLRALRLSALRLSLRHARLEVVPPLHDRLLLGQPSL
jgi:hypothetical protein